MSGESRTSPIGWHGYRTDRPYQMCTHCVLDTSNPAIVFDESGRCQYCKSVETNMIGKIWFPDGADRFDAVVENIRKQGRGKPYDIVLGLSGGLDSSYVVYLAVKKWGLRPLCLHIDTGWNSEIAVGNVENIVRTLDLDLHTEVLDWETMQDLQRSFLLSGVLGQDIPQDQAIIALQYKTAKKFDIKNLFGGWNPSSESINALIELPGHTLTDTRYIKAIHARYGRKPLDRYPLLSFFENYVYFPYIYRLRVHYPLRFMRFHAAEVRALLEREVGWRSYGEKHHESRWTRYYQSFYLPTRYALDKRRVHLASEIMSGNISRAAALDVLATPPFDPRLAELDEDYIKKKLDIGDNAYRDGLSRAPQPMNAYPNEANLILALGRLKRLLGISIRS